ncbi:MAG: exodeoxyribonuclease VII large subunit [Bacteroidales bacterium]|nr:exodeoxyribonuclease VII large subunit [Bacteroidales bacterium]
MPEIIDEKQVFTLKEVALSIQRTIEKRYTTGFWVKAEMNKLNFYKQSGHCYPDLLHKENGKVVAQMRALLWGTDFKNIGQRFEDSTGEKLRDGINILFLGKLTFDPNYGLTIRILDIDPSFTLGELEREKQEAIKRLKEEGIFLKNKQLQLPLLPKRIAIISVESSKGYADFVKLTESRMNGFVIEQMLFPSLLQGQKAVDQMLKQLGRIKKVSDHFDVVAIIRGGGGEVGLASFNDFRLARAIALFPIPVFTGIGHATNQTVCEMVSHTNSITPSELADKLLGHFENFINRLQNAAKTINLANRILNTENQQLSHFRLRMINQAKSVLTAQKANHILLGKSLQNATFSSLSKHAFSLENVKSTTQSITRKLLAQALNEVQKSEVNLQRNSMQFLLKCSNNIELSEKSITLLHPANVLKRGYSITLFNGKAVRSSIILKQGEQVTTILNEGSFISVVESIHENKKE